MTSSPDPKQRPLFTKELAAEYDKFVLERRQKVKRKVSTHFTARSSRGPDRSGY